MINLGDSVRNSVRNSCTFIESSIHRNFVRDIIRDSFQYPVWHSVHVIWNSVQDLIPEEEEHMGPPFCEGCTCDDLPEKDMDGTNFHGQCRACDLAWLPNVK